jgi:hypothetical protein
VSTLEDPLLTTTFVDVGGRRVRMARLGAGHPLLLLHGYPDNLQVWHRLAPRLVRGHEVIALVAGRMTVTPDGGSPTVIATGDLAVFPRGWSGTWDIEETVRKVYASF